MKAGKIAAETLSEFKGRIRAAATDLRRGRKVLMRTRIGFDDDAAKKQLKEELAKEKDYIGAAYYTVTDNRTLRDTGKVVLRLIPRSPKHLEELQELTKGELTFRGLKLRCAEDGLHLNGDMTDYQQKKRGRKLGSKNKKSEKQVTETQVETPEQISAQLEAEVEAAVATVTEDVTAPQETQTI